jgi:hypothetical protein
MPSVVRIIIRIGISVPAPVATSVPVVTSVPTVRYKMRSSVSCEAMAGKATKMAAARMATATTEASTTSSTMCERGGGRDRQNAG